MAKEWYEDLVGKELTVKNMESFNGAKLVVTGFNYHIGITLQYARNHHWPPRRKGDYFYCYRGPKAPFANRKAKADKEHRDIMTKMAKMVRRGVYDDDLAEAIMAYANGSAPSADNCPFAQ